MGVDHDIIQEASIMKLGKLPARENSITFKMAAYSSLPEAPSKGGHFSLVADWQGMLGNDKYGCCVWAGGDHEHICWNKSASKLVKFTNKNALADYSACTGFNPSNPNTDNGTDMQAAASYRRKTGLIDANGIRHKIGAYVAIDASTKTELKQAIYYFGAAGIGIQFPASAMAQFNNGKAWTVVSGSKIDCGHYVAAVGYDSRYVYVVTWGKIQKMTWGFYLKYCDEAIAYLSAEMLTDGKSLDGFNLAQLQANIKAL